MLIPCPHCGARPVQEFRYGGEAQARRPTAADGGDALAAVLYEADNPRGAAAEWWQHAAGCRTWFVATRDTMRDVIREDGP